MTHSRSAIFLSAIVMTIITIGTIFSPALGTTATQTITAIYGDTISIALDNPQVSCGFHLGENTRPVGHIHVDVTYPWTSWTLRVRDSMLEGGDLPEGYVVGHMYCSETHTALKDTLLVVANGDPTGHPAGFSTIASGQGDYIVDTGIHQTIEGDDMGGTYGIALIYSVNPTF